MTKTKEPRTALFSYGCSEYNRNTLKDRAEELFKLDPAIAIWYYMPLQDVMINMRIGDLKSHHLIGASRVYIKNKIEDQPYQVYKYQGLYQGGGFWYGERLAELKQHIRQHYERRLELCLGKQ